MAASIVASSLQQQNLTAEALGDDAAQPIESPSQIDGVERHGRQRMLEAMFGERIVTCISSSSAQNGTQ